MQNYVKDMNYQSLDKEIKRTMRRSAKDAVMLGCMLRRMMTARLWEECYDCFDDYLQNELHMDYTMASRFIGVNKKYSFGGDSMDIDEKWENYSQAVLIEMLSMPPELEERITPDMTVRQVREVKRQARQEKAEKQPETEPPQEDPEEQITENVPEWEDCREAEEASGREIPNVQYRELEAVEEVATSQPKYSPYGLAKSEYPEGSLIATAGCGNKYSCFSCAQNCGIRQKFRYCATAPLGNPFSCTTMEVLENLMAEVGDKCQFLNNDLAPHKQGSGEADPCCMDCKELCGYRCRRSSKGEGAPDAEYKAKTESEPPDDVDSESEESQQQFDELAEIRRILKKEQKTLAEYLAVEGLPAALMFKQKTIVAALAAMICDLENAQEKAIAQPELPKLKNNNQRKDWLNKYEDWGLWYRDDNIGVDYYKYDFDNGARLIAEVYAAEAAKYRSTYNACYLHLVGGPEPPKDKYGIGKWTRNEKYSRYPNSETELVEFLKEVQKGGVHD